ncbi:hypothetical protein H5410_011724 [Solanum commersonii]|uniref:Protein PsbN n=1 Tax=Solanum commersonii TaxID=4109 RepID=A0A9J6AQP4_SOLCO|nr:hypothetical protein H5410_011724 [Solanum commersonii]
METATLVAIFISGLLVSFTGYALYTAFGQPSQQLRDPFEEHGAIGTLGGSRKKIAKKIIPRVETKRNIKNEQE